MSKFNTAQYMKSYAEDYGTRQFNEAFEKLRSHMSVELHKVAHRGGFEYSVSISPFNSEFNVYQKIMEELKSLDYMIQETPIQVSPGQHVVLFKINWGKA